MDLQFLQAEADKLLGIKRTKAKAHKLKWKIPEARLTAPVEDADSTVSRLEKARARFLKGGEYAEAVHAKPVGESAFAYMLVRTDKKTEEEKIFAETYLLEEEDKLDLDVSSSFAIEENLEALGYHRAFARDYRAWWFSWLGLPVAVYDVEGFGAFLEIALPANNFEAHRRRDDANAFKLLDKLGIKKEEAIPTDAITVQLMMMAAQQDAGQPQAQQEGGKKGLF